MTDLSIQNLLPSSISCLTTTESATYNTHCQTLLLLLLQHVEVVLFEGVARCWFREQCYTHTHSALVYRHKQHPGIILPERLRRPFPVFCIFLLDIIFFFFIFPLLLKYFDWNSPFYWPIQMNEWRWRVCCAFKIKLMFLVAGGGWERSSVNKDSPNTGHWVTDEWMRKTSTTWLGLIVEEHYKIVHELYLCTGYPVEPIGTQDDTLQEDHILHIRWSSHWSMCCS